MYNAIMQDIEKKGITDKEKEWISGSIKSMIEGLNDS